MSGAFSGSQPCRQNPHMTNLTQSLASPAAKPVQTRSQENTTLNECVGQELSKGSGMDEAGTSFLRNRSWTSLRMHQVC